MKRHVFLIPGFFGFANLGDFAYWGPVLHKLRDLFDEAGLEAEIHCVKSLPTASLRTPSPGPKESMYGIVESPSSDGLTKRARV